MSEGAAGRLAGIRRRLAELGRPGVRIVAVTKTHGPEVIRELLSAGHQDFGENRVGEARAKFQLITPSTISPIYHYLGPLQSGQARHVAETFDFVHGVTSMGALEALRRECGKRREKERGALRYLVQVKLTEEAGKLGGMTAEELASCAPFSSDPCCVFSGFMTMGPATGRPEDARPIFRRLRELRDQHLPGGELSMGMSDDWELAVEEGASMIRIGTALFGERHGGPWIP